MRFWHKLVSTGLLAVVVLLPLASFAMCAPESSSAMNCAPDCPMMAQMMESGLHAVEYSSSARGSCCTIESSKPTPVTESKVAAQFVSIQRPADVGAVIANPSALSITHADSSPPLCRNSQSRLCTFQI